MCCYVCCLLCLIALISPVLPQEQSQSDLRLLRDVGQRTLGYLTYPQGPITFFLIGFNTGGFLKYGDPYILVSLYLCIFSTKPYGW